MEAPHITVAILTRNAGPTLARIVEAVRAQSTSRRVELLAIDSGSHDGTPDLLRRAGARVVEIDPSAFDFGLTRDLAFEHAQGEVVVSLSQDAVPAHDGWLDHLVQPLDDPGVGAACGRSVPDPARAHPQFIWERNGLFYFTREMRRFAARHGRGLSNANSAIPRAIWARLRFGRQPIGEDYLFQTKLHEAGLRVAFPEGAEVLHHHAYTLAALWQRCREEGVGLRLLGFPYSLADALADMATPRVWAAWARAMVRGDLAAPADWLFPAVRPLAVRAGARTPRARGSRAEGTP